MPGLTPHLVSTDASKAVDFYKNAFGAAEIMRMPAEDGKRLMHVELVINGSRMFMCDEFPEYCGGKSRTTQTLGGTPITLHLDVPDCDAAMEKAAAAGANVTMPAADMFWGDRYGKVMDPFGFEWSFAHPLKK